MAGGKVCRRLWNVPLQQQQPAKAGYYTTPIRVFLSAQSPLSARWRRGAAPCSWEPDHCFFASLVSRWKGSTTGLKQKPKMTGASLSPKSTARDTRAAWLCAMQRCGQRHLPHAIGFSPMHPQAGSPPGCMLQHPQPFPHKQGGTCWGRAPQDLLWPLPTTPVASVKRFIPPTSTASNIPELHLSGSGASPSVQPRLQPGSNCGMEGVVGAGLVGGCFNLQCHLRLSPAFPGYWVAQLVGQSIFVTLILQFNATISHCSMFIASSIFPSGSPQAAHPIQKAESIKRKM